MDIYIVDAFTDTAFKGNPAAVCVLDREYSDQWMQRVANEMNLSETAFVMRNKDWFELRWFTPLVEVDLCGHATLATAHILWEQQFSDRYEITFSTKSGLLSAIRNGDWIELQFPLENAEAMSPPETLINGLGLPYVEVRKNRLDYIVELESEDLVRSLQPNYQLWAALSARGVIVTSKSEQTGIDFVSRCFYPALGVNEDPVTGSAHCGLGPYWQEKLGKNEFVAKQLSKREGLLKLALEKEYISIAGQAVTTLKGKLTID